MDPVLGDQQGMLCQDCNEYRFGASTKTGDKQCKQEYRKT